MKSLRWVVFCLVLASVACRGDVGPVAVEAPPVIEEVEEVEEVEMPEDESWIGEYFYRRIVQPDMGRNIESRWTGTRVRADGTVEFLREGDWSEGRLLPEQARQELIRILVTLDRDGVPRNIRPEHATRGGAHTLWTLSLPSGEQEVHVWPGGRSEALDELSRVLSRWPR